MVIQRGWRSASGDGGAGAGSNGNGGVATGQLTSSSEDSNGSWAAPARVPAGRVAATPHAVPSRQPITRQVAINTLAAMHRRFSLPGPVQPHSRPVAEFRASANKSLDMLRQTIQSAVTKEIDQVIKKYLEKFFVPAVNNIRLNLGEESVSEDQVRAVCRAMLDATRALYAVPPRPVPSPAESDSDSSETADARLSRQHNSPLCKRKESDTDSEGGGSRRKRIKQEENSDRENVPSPLPPAAARDPHKWNPARLTQDTLFIMGSHAHKVRQYFTPSQKLLLYKAQIQSCVEYCSHLWDGSAKHLLSSLDSIQRRAIRIIKDPEVSRNLESLQLRRDIGSLSVFYRLYHGECSKELHEVLGLGNSRGRLYTKHSGLLRYPADSADKEWIATHNLMNAVGGKTYIMVLEDIEELAATDHYRNNALPMLGELTGFKAPPFMLKKMKTFLAKRLLMGGNASAPASPQPSTSSLNFDTGTIKLEVPDDDKTEQNNATSTDDFPELLPVKEEDPDFDLIKVDGIKVEDIEDLKVEGIKVEDIDVDDIKVENIDDISVDEIKVEDIKLENEDAFSMCKQSDDEQSNLVEGLLDADIEFLSRNLGNIESEADARKTIEKLTGANPDTLTLMGDEFDFGTTLNTNESDTQTTKCITVASTTSGMIHSVPVAHLTTASRIGNTVHYTAHYTGGVTAGGQARGSQRTTIHHLPQATVTIHSVPGAASQLIRGLPINTKTGTFSTVMSTGTASIIGIGARAPATAVSAQYVNVTPKSFPTGNILHNAIVSRNMISRNILNTTPGTTYGVSRPVFHTTTSKITTPATNSNDFDAISTTKDMIDNACNSSVMLKKVLTLGSAGVTKSFMMQNTQKILSTGFATGSGPAPNVTVVSSGNSLSTSSTLSATYATLSALLAASTDNSGAKNNS